MLRAHRDTGVVAGLALAWYALPHIGWGPLPEMLGVPLLLALVVVAPGIALTRMLGARPRDAVETAAVWSAHGLVVLLIATFVWALTGASLNLFRTLLAPVIVVLYAIAPRADAARIDVMHCESPTGGRRARTALLVVLVAIAIAIAVAGPPLDYSKDTIDHVGYVNEVARSEQAFPTTAVFIDGGADGADLRKSVLHAVYGTVSSHLGIDGLRAIAALNPFLFLIMSLAVYSAALTMFASRMTAVLACALFALTFEGGLGSSLVRTAFYPNRFGVGMLVLFTASALAYLATRSRMSRRMCALYAFAAAAIHIQFAVFVCVVVGMIAVWKTCSPCRAWGEHARRASMIAVMTAIGLVPIVIFRYATAYQANALHLQVQGAVFVAGDWFVTNPLRTWTSLGWIGIAALVAIVPLWKQRRDVPGIGFVVAALPTILFVQYNPLLLKPLYGVITYLAYRLDRAVPYYMLTAFLLATLPAQVGSMARRRETWGLFAAVILAAVGVIAGLAPLAGHNAFSPSTLRAERHVSSRSWETALRRISAMVPATAVIASDPVTSYAMSAFTPSFVVCTLDQHTPPNDTRFESRMSAARDILSPYTTIDDKIAALDSHYARFIVVNTSLPPALTLNYWTMHPTMATLALDVFDDYPQSFERTALGDGLVMYRWTGTRPRGRAERPIPPINEYIPRDATPIGRMSGEAALVGARIGRETVTPGVPFAVDLYWSRTRELPEGTYLVSIRFDRVGLTLPFAGRPFPKITRKAVESFRDERYRFRRDHMVLAGVFSPDAWPIDAIVQDANTLTVPDGVAPGRYRIEAKMLRVANSPNVNLRDFLYDDDIYTGVPIGEITVE